MRSSTRSAPLPFAPPWIGDEEVEEVVETLRSGWLTTGPRTNQFEGLFATAVGAPAALALSSGTAALHTALAVLGVGPGDAVVTTPLTFCSCVHVIEQLGARPVLVDVEPMTLNIDVSNVARALEQPPEGVDRFKCVLPVHLYGNPCDLERLTDVAAEHGVAIVDDAAHALPASIDGRTIGSWAPDAPVPILTAFSFYATKNITTGEGGMLTGPPQLLDEARSWSLHGMSRDAWNRYTAEGQWAYDVTVPGFKYNMSDIQAALGLRQLNRLRAVHTRRSAIARAYTAAFSQLEELQAPPDRVDDGHAWHIYALRLNLDRLTISRSQFIDELASRNIGASVHFIPIHLFTYYKQRYGYEEEAFPIAFREYQRLVSLPLYPQMSDEDVEDVIEAVRDVVVRSRR